jgi:hypothetical protein
VVTSTVPTLRFAVPAGSRCLAKMNGAPVVVYPAQGVAVRQARRRERSAVAPCSAVEPWVRHLHWEATAVRRRAQAPEV